MIEDKILIIFNRSGLSRTDFANKLGIANAVLSHLASGRNKASLDLVINILTYFPDISSDWLILNKGEMLRSPIENNADKIKLNLLDYLNKITHANNLTHEKIKNLETEIQNIKD